MTIRRRHTGKGPTPWVASSLVPALEIDLDLDLNPLDDPNAGFVYVEPDTEPGVFDARVCDPAARSASD